MLQDCAQGIIFPDVYGHLAKWCALKERSLLGGVSQSGFDMALGFLCSGLVVVTPLGWTAIFMCLVREFVVISFVMILYVIFVFASNRCSWCDMVGAPCCVILTSVPYLVLRLVKLSHGLSTFTLMQQIPLYFNGLYDYETHVNAVLSTLPFFLMFVTSHLVTAVGSSLNHVDLSPNIGGMLVGMTNMVVTGMGVISPIAVAEIVKNEVGIFKRFQIYCV